MSIVNAFTGDFLPEGIPSQDRFTRLISGASGQRHLCPQQVVLDNVSSKAYADAVQAAEPDQGGTFHTCRAPACPSSAQSHGALASRVIQTNEVALS